MRASQTPMVNANALKKTFNSGRRQTSWAAATDSVPTMRNHGDGRTTMPTTTAISDHVNEWWS